MSSAAIDQALIAMLGADTTLLSYMTNGVYRKGEVPPKSTRFVEVSVTTAVDVWEFQRRAFEDCLYLVEAVMLSTAGTKEVITNAEARIDALLDGQALGLGSPLAVDGYRCMAMARELRLPPISEPDELDRQWWHRGGYYRIQMAVIF